MSSLLIVLHLIESLLYRDRSTMFLRSLTGLSDRQVKRLIGEAQELGADIVSIREGKSHIWCLQNSDRIQKSGILEKWIALEEKRTILESQSKLL